MTRHSLLGAVATIAVASAQYIPAQPDYLRMPNPLQFYVTSVVEDASASTITLSNGLLTRIFTTGPNGAFGTTEYRLEAGDGLSFIRGYTPEGRIYLDNQTEATGGFNVGGFMGQNTVLILYTDTITTIPDPSAMSMLNYSYGPITPAYNYTPRWGVSNSSWPPPGIHMQILFGPPAATNGNSSEFIELDNTGLGCDAPLTCLTGFYRCDNTSVAGQCTFPKANATQFCEEWDQCVAVTCNNGRNDCQARSSSSQAYSASFTSYVKPGTFPYPNLRVVVHYEMFDGIPSIAKWIECYNADPTTAGPVIQNVNIEIVRVPWELRSHFHAETAFMPSLGIRNSLSDAGYYFEPDNSPDSFYGLLSSTVNLWVYDQQLMGPWGADDADEYWYDTGFNETMLQVGFPFGPGLNITTIPLTTFRVHEVLNDFDNIDRMGLGRKKMLRTVAPSTSEDFGPWYAVGCDSIRQGVDMASSVGFYAIHTTCDPFNFDPAYIAQVKSDLAYAHSKNIYAGFYVLLQNPPGLNFSTEALDINGNGEGIACFATDFHAQFRAGIVAFVQATGFDYIDTDGPYEAAPCSSTHHEHHLNLLDSQYSQWRDNVEWYKSLPSQPNPFSLMGTGITITCPDPYELASGTVAQPIGYTDHWNDMGDRWVYLLMARIYAYDGTLTKTPTNGLLPFDLSRTGGMSTADDLQFWDTSLAVVIGLAGRNFFNGALYQNNASQAILQTWMNTFNTYRELINSDIIHVRKPTGRSWDAIMHANPSLPAGKAKCFVVFFNPQYTTTIALSTNLNVYYCGFDVGATVTVLWNDGSTEQVPQDAGFSVKLTKSIPTKGYVWAALS